MRSNSTNESEDVAIFWDYENCPAPASCTGYDLINTVRSVARQFGSVKLFKAYLEVSEQVLNARSLTLRSELQASGVSLTDCPHNGRKDVADKMMLVDMLAHAIDHPAPLTYLLISGDRDFAYALSILRLRQYKVVLITLPNAHASLRAQASVCLDWISDVIETALPPPPPPLPCSPKKEAFTPAATRTAAPSSPENHGRASTSHNGGGGGGGCFRSGSPSKSQRCSHSTKFTREAADDLPASAGKFRFNYSESHVSVDVRGGRNHEGAAPSPFPAPAPVPVPEQGRSESRYSDGSSSIPPFRPPPPFKSPKKKPISLHQQQAEDSQDEWSQRYYSRQSSQWRGPEQRTAATADHPGEEPNHPSRAESLDSTIGKEEHQHGDAEEGGAAPSGLKPVFNFDADVFVPSPPLQPPPPPPPPRGDAQVDDFSARADTEEREGSGSPTAVFEESKKDKDTDEVEVKVVPPIFKPLIRQLQFYRMKGFYLPLRSVVGFDLVTRHSNVYANAGVKKFTEYVAMAEKAGYVESGGIGGNAWIKLQPEWNNAK